MHASRADLPAQVLGEYEGRFVDWGETRVAIETMPAHFPPDESPFKGLPDDRCQCPHWGYVAKGSFTVAYLDGSEERVKEVIAAAPKCRIVCRLGIGLDNIDVAYCTSQKIPVTNIPVGNRANPPASRPIRPKLRLVSPSATSRMNAHACRD